MRDALYVIGEPGAGKSALVDTLVYGTERYVEEVPLRRLVYANGVVELGDRGGDWAGTDRLPFNVQRKAEAWARDTRAERLLAEGDRLANEPFFDALLAAGWNLTVVCVRVPAVEAAERRAARGGGQDESWVRGRRTKVERLAGVYPERTTYVWNRHDELDAAVEALRRASGVAAAFPSCG